MLKADSGMHFVRLIVTKQTAREAEDYMFLPLSIFACLIVQTTVHEFNILKSVLRSYCVCAKFHVDQSNGVRDAHTHTDGRIKNNMQFGLPACLDADCHVMPRTTCTYRCH